MSMLFKRIKDWATSITAFRTGDVIPVDGPSGTAKMGKDDLLKVTAENARSYSDFELGYFSEAAESGVDFEAFARLTASAGEKIIFKLSVDDGIVDANGLNFDCLDADGNSVQYLSQKVYNEFVEFTATADFELIRIKRSAAGIIGSGDIQLIALSERAFRAYLEHRLEPVQDLSGRLQELKVTSGKNFIGYVSAEIKKDVPFYFYINCEGLFSSNNLNVSFEDDAGNTQSLPMLHTFNGLVSYYPDADYTKIKFARSSSGVIASGTLKVVTQPTENPVDIYTELGAVVNLQVNTGSNFNGYVKADLKANVPFYVKVSGSGLMSTDALNAYLEDDAGNSQTLPIYSTFDRVVELLPDANYTKICFKRASGSIVSSGALTVTTYPTGIIGEEFGTLMRGEMYVSLTGDDANLGTKELPKRTITAALADGAEIVNVMGGVYDDNYINTSVSPKNKVIIKGEQGKKVIFKKASSLIANDGSEVLVAGTTKVYSVACSAISYSAGTQWLFFDDCPEVGTAITPAEAHPLERGKFYRLDCTRSNHTTATTKAEAITEIEACCANEYKWYYDSGDGKVYFNRPGATSTYPLYKSGNGFFITRNGQELELYNIEFRYGRVNLIGLNGVKVYDCACKYAYGGGAWDYRDSICVEFIKCEAACAFSGDVGDGFNGHATAGTYIDAKYNTCTMRECWSHDNNDDGYSDHEFAETVVDGGLYEYNGKGGVTPSFGCGCVCKNVMSRYNFNGFYYIGAKSDSGNEGQMVCYNCISIGNTHSDAAAGGFRVAGGANKIILVNCQSINDKNGYSGTSGTRVELYNCTCKNPSVSVKTGSATFAIENGTIVE